MAKQQCHCDTHGCAHFSAGNCRISNLKCTMSINSYHYGCCNFLNSVQGQTLLKRYLEERFKGKELEKAICKKCGQEVYKGMCEEYHMDQELVFMCLPCNKSFLDYHNQRSGK